ncbi:MAG TPA: PASTA domain-containing protein, partial [Terriglobales bacterium]|nr:PASTA domain-containing protein [Terriglobales bacterium]
MKAFLRLAFVALVLLVVAMASALLAMRFAIHGGEVVVPKVTGIAPVDAERAVAGLGLTLQVERQYYSVDIPEGKIISQIPAAGMKVRRGWQ